MANVEVGSARSDENRRAYGGKAGDQTGREVSTQGWYLHSKGWRVFRAKDRAKALAIAWCMKAACANNHIGYDQYQRNDLYKEAAKYGFDVSKVTKNVECDCSALVRVCCAYAGIMGLPADFRTGNMPANLMRTGAFVELTGAKYQSQSQYLAAGDILVTKTSGHTVVVLNDGAKYEGDVTLREYELGERILRHGDEGEDVRQMQSGLIRLGYDLGRWGVDGDFGDCTELAVRAFQKDNGLPETGKFDAAALAALDAALAALERTPESPRVVRVEGGDCYVRKGPGTQYGIIGVAKRGAELPYGGQTAENGWPLVEYDGRNGWVSNKYGRVI